MKKIVLRLIDFYQKAISPYKGGSCCIYTPTCSEYMRQAVQKYGVLIGITKGLIRIFRCNPFTKGGYDPLK